MPKETAQKLGIDGVHEIKEWLESTTRFAFTFTVYDSAPKCTVTCLDGTMKTLDLEGVTTTQDKVPVSVECKRYSNASGQGVEFRRFLAIAYSSTAHVRELHGVDERREFMWVTFHPFSQGKWKKLLSVSYLRECVLEHPGLLGEHEMDEDLLSEVSGRLWLMVVHKRQMSLRLSKHELATVNTALIKEGYH